MKKIREPRKNVYKHLHSYERDEIAYMLAEGYTKKEIALVESASFNYRLRDN